MEGKLGLKNPFNTAWPLTSSQTRASVSKTGKWPRERVWPAWGLKIETGTGKKTLLTVDGPKIVRNVYRYKQKGFKIMQTLNQWSHWAASIRHAVSKQNTRKKSSRAPLTTDDKKISF